jgi:general secretion pathway protein E
MMMRSQGSWARTASVSRRSTPAFLLATVVVAIAGFLIASESGIAHPQQYVPLLALAGVVTAGVFLLKNTLGWAWASIPTRARPAPPIPVHTLAEARGFVAELCRRADPDIPHLIDYLLARAIDARASDIHLVPYEGFVAVRFRVDGILQDVAELPEAVRHPVANRLKVLSRLVTFVHDRPQDGRFERRGGARSVDVRVACMPTLHGERIVLRLIRSPESSLALEALGLTPEQQATFTELLRRPQGLIVLTGPAGSGKTTTIYAALQTILEQSARSRSIYTLEDPIEHDLLLINQTQIEEARGFSFAQGLRSLLRQDPDVIMVGEIRDLETARIALQAGMTGHLIITTVHAGSAAGGFARLIEMGGDAHSVAAAVTAVVGQRLVRLLCPHCKRREPPASWLAGDEGTTFYGPAGCPQCGMKGFQGRRAIFEILEVDEGLSRLVVGRAGPDELRREAARRGLPTLHQLGLDMARRGETSLTEVLRVAPPEMEG